MQPDADVDGEVKDDKKSAKLTPTFYTATYFGLMKKNKKQYKLTEAD